jgi:hypothetical protein
MKTLLNFAAVLMLFCATQSNAAISFSLTIQKEVKPAYDNSYGDTWYMAFGGMTDTTTPLSYHRIESPTGAFSSNFGPTNSGYGVFIQNSEADLFNALTNGNWKLWLNKETPQERLYTFKVNSTALVSNLFGQIVITSPRDGGINVSSNAPYTWSGPAGWDQIVVNVENNIGDTLSGTETNWLTGPTMSPGTNKFLVRYERDVTASFNITTPTNATFGLLTNWSISYVQFRSDRRSGFIAEGLTSPLTEALDAPGMVWETQGDANWFSQTNITHDGVDAARSGPIGDDESTTLRTVIYGTNEISFWWKTDSEENGDYVEFYDNGNFIAGLSGDSGWQQFTHELTNGEVHVLEWTYSKDSVLADGADAAFLDQVSLLSTPTNYPVDVSINFSVVRNKPHDGVDDQFMCFPTLISVNVPELTEHRIESPNALFEGTLSGGGATVQPTYGDLVNELTNGVWRLYINKNHASERLFTFTVSVNGLTTNLFRRALITSPVHGATNVPVNPAFTWGGLTNFGNVFVQSSRVPFTNVASEFLPGSATTWPSPPILFPGTNIFYISYSSNNSPFFTFSMPVDGSGFPLNSWSQNTHLNSDASVQFVVVPSTNTTPVSLVNAQRTGGNFQFQFQSQSGRTNTVQSRTNLATGIWINRTNIPGDGTLKTVVLPVGSNPSEFFRISTQ